MLTVGTISSQKCAQYSGCVIIASGREVDGVVAAGGVTKGGAAHEVEAAAWRLRMIGPVHVIPLVIPRCAKSCFRVSASHGVREGLQQPVCK